MSTDIKYVYVLSVAETEDDFQYGDNILGCYSDANKAIDEGEKFINEHTSVYKVIRLELK